MFRVTFLQNSNKSFRIKKPRIWFSPVSSIARLRGSGGMSTPGSNRVERQPNRGQADQCSIICHLGWRAGNKNHLSSEGSNAHPVVMEDITVVYFYSRYRGVHFSSETVMMLIRQLSHAIKTRWKERNARSQTGNPRQRKPFRNNFTVQSNTLPLQQPPTPASKFFFKQI